MRIADELLRNGIAAFGIGSNDANGRGVRMNVVQIILKVALLFMQKGLTVGEDQLHVTSLRMIDRRVINLVEDTVRKGVPDAARSGIRSGNGIFLAGGPAGFETGSAKRSSLIVEPAVGGCEIAHCTIRLQNSAKRFCLNGE